MAVFLLELLRTARRGRLTLVRVGYGLVLLAAVYALFRRAFPAAAPLTLTAVVAPGERARLARFAGEFAAVGLWVQLAAVLVLTPLAAAGAVAGERARGSLDLLRVSRLSPAAIV